MAKRKRMIRAGRLCLVTLSTMPLPRDPDAVRAAKSHCTSAARQAMNLKHSCRKLELLLAANFAADGLFVTLTYADGHLPGDRKAASARLRKCLQQLRAHRRARGQALRYIYVTEGLHGDKRVHHHLVINDCGDLEIVHSLWTHGFAASRRVDPAQLAELARYLTKEPRDGIAQNGRRCWTPSLNLVRPQVSSEIVDDDLTLTPPPGATVLESDGMRNAYGEFAYIKYLLPAPVAHPFRRPGRRRKTAS